MSTTQNERLRGLLEPLVSARHLDLEDIEVSRAGRRRVLRVIVDSDAGVELDACAELSRVISDTLDETDAMGEGEYVLEVSSPGADRPSPSTATTYGPPAASSSCTCTTEPRSSPGSSASTTRDSTWRCPG